MSGAWVGGSDGTQERVSGDAAQELSHRQEVRASSRLPVLPAEGQVDAVAASWWTATIMRPSLVGSEGEDARLPTPQLLRVAPNSESPGATFRQGYQDFGGRTEWEEHFVTDVILGCENKTYGWVWHPEASSFITVAQFHRDSWARASAATGLGDPYNLYHVGAAVAVWSTSIEHPGNSGGWAECWWEGIVP